jgi:hypothetical protein
VDTSEIRSVLQKLGEKLPAGSRLTLVGGGALALLGSPRLTIDLDFIGDDVAPSKLDKAIVDAANELNIYADPVRLERFLPLPKGSEGRTISVGQFGNLEVRVADPYSMALSKLDRGFDTDVDDIVFLIQRGFIYLDELERFTQDLLPRARDFDINSADLLARLELVRGRI